ncbi:MAG: histidinol-phosphate transaminase [Myxococcota bacterium]
MSSSDSLVASHIAGIVPYVPGKPIDEVERELGLPPGRAIKLASNENALGPSPRAVAAMRDAAASSHLYPDGSAWTLRQALAERHGVAPEEIVVGAGSNELINLLVQAFVGQGEEALLAEQSFLCYELACRALGAAYRRVPLLNLTFDLDGMAAAASPRTKIVFVANPNNPTGTYVARATLARFLDRLPPRVIVVVDEAYFEYADAPDYPDALQYRARRPRLVVLRTFSKIHGLAGMRVGYAICEPEIAGYLHRVRAPFNVSSGAQAAALAALGDDEHVRRSRASNLAERPRLAQALERLGCAVLPSQANFLLVETPAQPLSAAGLYQALLRRGVIVRPLANYALPDHLRITVGTPQENDCLVDHLRGILRT